MKKHLNYLLFGFAIVFVAVIRLHLADVPLERDEGEYAYMAQLLRQGIVPYSEAYNMKFPGIYFIYTAILTLFGETHTGIHFALLLVNTLTAVLLFQLGKTLYNNLAGLLTGISFLVLTLIPEVQGVWANAEHFVILFSTGGLLLLTYTLNRHNIYNLLLSGFLLGISFLIKQHAVFFVVFGMIFLLQTYLRSRNISAKKLSVRLAIFISGITLPFVTVSIIYLSAGIFDKLWFWTVIYATDYVSLLSLSQGIANFKMSSVPLFQSSASIIILAAIGLIVLLADKRIRPKWIFPFGFLLFSFFSLCPGLYFRPHYFILLLPALSLFSGMAAGYIINNSFYSFVKVTVSLLITMSLMYPFFIRHGFLFTMSPIEASRYVYGLNPFPESLEVAKYIRENSSKEDRIAILGSEPQILFYSQRRSATGYLYKYALMEPHDFAEKMQKEMIAEIKDAHPEIIVLVDVPTSWLMRKDSKKILHNWFPIYLKEYYKLAKIIDIMKVDQKINNVPGLIPSGYKLNIFKKLREE